MVRIGRRTRITLISVLVAILVGSGIATGVYFFYQNDRQNRAEAATEFQEDLVRAGFASSMQDTSLQVGWKNESEQKCDNSGHNCSTRTEEELDATVVIGGCPVELERDSASAMGIDEIRDGVKVIKFYKFDEVKVGDDPDGIDVTLAGRDRRPFDTSHPTRDQVYDYLTAHAHSFPCFAPGR